VQLAATKLKRPPSTKCCYSCPT